MHFNSIQEIETFFANIQHKKRDYPTFLMLKKALALLHNPQNDFQYIQITGTNGKGSTSTYLSHFLAAHQIRVGLFTSPHIFSITERIRYNNQAISPTDFITTFNHIYDIVNESCKLIQFEWLFLLMLMYYKQKALDVVILEVGIGGLFDTTNIIPEKLAAVITNVDYDHQSLLGNTLAEIAEQKAGIMTDTTKFVFLGNMKPTVKTLMVTQAEVHHIQSYCWDYDFSYNAVDNFFQIFQYKIANRNEHLPIYQYENIALALAIAVKMLGAIFEKRLNPISVETIIETLQLPIRFEMIKTENHLHVFDGAHNIAGINTMLKTLKARFPNQAYTFIFCAMADKEYVEMLKLLTGAGKVCLYDYHKIYHRAFIIEKQTTTPVIHDPIELADFIAKEKNEILVYVGSIYYVSYIREIFQKESSYVKNGKY